MNVEEKDVKSYISFVLNRYHKEKKLLDKFGIDEIIKSLIILNELEDYITDVTYLPSSNVYANMSYSFMDKSINVSPDFMKGLKRSSKQLLDLFNIHDEIASTNLDIVHSIIHEIMHAKQYKFIDEANNKLIREILLKSLTAATYLTTSNKDDALKYAAATKDADFYSLMPSEINAEINALKQTYDIVEKTNLEHKYKYLDFYLMSIDLVSINSYKLKTFKVLSPVERFLKTRKKYIKEDNIKLENIYGFDLDTRLSYGLPIKKSEYNVINNRINDKIKELYTNSKMN